MIDTYMDRSDAATGYRPPPAKPVDREDPRYWAGQLYATVTDCNVARARAVLRWELSQNALEHRHETRLGIRMGSEHSVFTANGKRKLIF